MRTEVIVAGAGPTGLALACGLRAAGVDVRVLDKAAAPAVTSRALGLQPRGVEVLDRLGALGDLPARGLPIRSVTINVDGRELARFPVGQPTRLGGPRGLLMSQADIEGALRDRLAARGGDVEWGRGISGLLLRADGVTVRLNDGSEADDAWVVGADGAHSVVRKALAIGFPRGAGRRAFPARRRACRYRRTARGRDLVAARGHGARCLPTARRRLVASDGARTNRFRR